MVENEQKIKGEHEDSVERARRMIEKGIGATEIMRVTSLNPEEIKKIKHNMNEK